MLASFCECGLLTYTLFLAFTIQSVSLRHKSDSRIHV